MTTLIDRAAPQGELDSFLSAFSGAAAEAEATPAPRGGELDAAVVTAPPDARGDDNGSLLPEAGKYREDAVDWASNAMPPGAGGLAAAADTTPAAANDHQPNAPSPAQPPLLIDEEMTKAASSELTKRQRKPTWKLQSPGLDGDAIARPLVQQQNAIQPTPQDVLLRFGNQHEPMANSHAGTGHVKLIVDALALESYASLRRAGRVQEFVAGVISHVHSQGGRFLQRDAGVGDWIEVDDVKARRMLSGRLEKRNKRAAESQSRLGAVSMAAAARGGAMPIRGEEPKSIGGAVDFASGCFSPPQSSYFVRGNDVFMG